MGVTSYLLIILYAYLISSVYIGGMEVMLVATGNRTPFFKLLARVGWGAVAVVTLAFIINL